MSDSTPSNTDADLFAPSAARLATLFFSDLDDLGTFLPVLIDALPNNYRSLLAHQDHMTVALEAFHNSLVNVHPLLEWHDEASYARCSLLSRQTDGAVVQFGIMRIWMSDLAHEVQEEITRKQTPLGRVLIRHNLLREVELMTLWQITTGPVLRQHLSLPEGGIVFGRSAQILVDQRPTVQLLEIVNLPP